MLANRYHEILDFINMHCCLTPLSDTSYWLEQPDPWYEQQQSRTRLFKQVLDAVQAASRQLPPHAQWLQSVLGLQPYRKTA